MKKQTAGLIVLLLLITAGLPCVAQQYTLFGKTITLPEAPPRHDFPRVGNYEVLSCDFHMHTVNSDGWLTTRERVTESYKFGYDVIAITDHKSTRAYPLAVRIAKPLGMLVIKGLETSLGGKEHLNIIGASDAYQPIKGEWEETDSAGGMPYQTALKRVAKDGGIVVYNHPHVGFRDQVQWGVKQDLIQGIEVKNFAVANGWKTVLSHGTYCYPSAFDWALENNIAVFADSDMHGPRPDANEPITLVLATERSRNAVIEAIRARRTVAWFNGMLWGRQELLSDLVVSMVKIHRTPQGSLILENQSPVTLEATINTDVTKTVEFPAYKETPLEQSGISDSLTLVWQNIWINPRDNLKSTIVVRGFTPSPDKGSAP